MGRFVDSIDEEINLHRNADVRGTLDGGEMAARQMIQQGCGDSINNDTSMARKRGWIVNSRVLRRDEECLRESNPSDGLQNCAL